MPSEVLRQHFQRMAAIYGSITPGERLHKPDERPEAEAAVLAEIAKARTEIRQRIGNLQRPRPIQLEMGEPQGSWAHVYYVSFHDPANSHGPREGFYPVFLLSVDQGVCWLSVMLAAASVGISGRGGWSQRRGEKLRTRAEFLAQTLTEQNDWRAGPVQLGAGGAYLHKGDGATQSAGRGYECGTIISRSFEPRDPPQNLAEWLREAFTYYDAILSGEEMYLETSVTHLSVADSREQANAAITGTEAEQQFLQWVAGAHPEWGPPEDRTGRVGLGFDVEFPQSGVRAEVKGCRGEIEGIRMTEREWHVAQESEDNYVLCIVSHLDDAAGPRFHTIPNPHARLRAAASRQRRLQITYTVPQSAVAQHAQEENVP